MPQAYLSYLVNLISFHSTVCKILLAKERYLLSKNAETSRNSLSSGKPTTELSITLPVMAENLKISSDQPITEVLKGLTMDKHDFDRVMLLFPH